MLQSPKSRKQRCAGKITQRPLPTATTFTNTSHKKQYDPLSDVTVNNINLCAEIQCINAERDRIFYRYQQVIKDLQLWVKQLQQRNYFLEEDRNRLFMQNIQLEKKMEIQKDTCLLDAGNGKKNMRVFEIVQEEDTIDHIFHRSNQSEDKQIANQEAILEQSDLQVQNISKFKGHYFDDQDKQFSLHSNSQQSPQNSEQIKKKTHPLKQQSSSQQITPCLKHHHSIIQVNSNSHQSPIRIFYLLLLQDTNNHSKILQLLHLQHQVQNSIFPLYSQNNSIWYNILISFIDYVKTGSFQDQVEVIQYINKNILIDMLMVNSFKNITHMAEDAYNDSQQLRYSQSCLNDNTHSKQYTHQRIFRALANQFELQFEKNQQRDQYLFFKIHQKKRQVSEQMLLQSREIDRTILSVQQQLEISLHPQPQLRNGQVHMSREQPLFKIKFDNSKSYYRAYISIQPRDQQIDECCTSFNDNNQQNQYESEQDEDEEEEQKQNQIDNNYVITFPESTLREIDRNSSLKLPKRQKRYQLGSDGLIPKSLTQSFNQDMIF